MPSNLEGTWKKTTQTPCSQIYPDEITFKKQGIYFAQNDPETTVHPIWDSGGYKVIRANQVKISTANDAEITYKFSISEDTLTFIDGTKCEFQYQKSK